MPSRAAVLNPPAAATAADEEVAAAAVVDVCEVEVAEDELGVVEEADDVAVADAAAGVSVAAADSMTENAEPAALIN